MSKDKNTKTDVINDVVVGLNNILSNELSIKEVVIFAAKCVALIILVVFVAIALLFSLDSFIAKAVVLVVALLIIKGLLLVVWFKKIEFFSKGAMSYIRGAANLKK